MLGVGGHLFAHQITGHRNRTVHQIANNLFDITPNISNLGKLGGLNLDKRGFGQFRQATADLSFSHSRWPNHQDIFRIDLIAQIIAQLLAAPPVAECHCDSAFGVFLSNDKTVQFGDDFAGG